MISLENIMIAIITSIATLLVAVIGLLGSKKFTTRKPISFSEQTKLIAALKDTLMVQTERIRLLEAAHAEQIIILEARDEEIKDLKRRVSNLETLTIEQALTIRQLPQIRRRVRRLPHTEGGEVNKNEDDRTQ